MNFDKMKNSSLARKQKIYYNESEDIVKHFTNYNQLGDSEDYETSK